MADPSNWQSLYQGGLGTRLSVNTSSANVAVPGSAVVNQMEITNLGAVPAFLKVGVDSDLAATTSCKILYPGVPLILPVQPYVAAITESDTTTLLITSGNGAPL